MFGGSAASSFVDDIIKWQKTLQNLEAVLVLWWEVQQKWIKLDDVSSNSLRELVTVSMFSFNWTKLKLDTELFVWPCFVHSA